MPKKMNIRNSKNLETVKFFDDTAKALDFHLIGKAKDDLNFDSELEEQIDEIIIDAVNKLSVLLDMKYKK